MAVTSLEGDSVNDLLLRIQLEECFDAGGFSRSSLGVSCILLQDTATVSCIGTNTSLLTREKRRQRLQFLTQARHLMPQPFLQAMPAGLIHSRPSPTTALILSRELSERCELVQARVGQNNN